MQDHTTETLLAETRALRRMASALLGDDHAAEDVAQDAVVAALEQRPATRQGLRPWLATVSRRIALRRRQREGDRRARERAMARDERLDATDETVATLEVHRRVVNAVSGLNEPYRTTVVLRFWEDLTPREIAKRQGIPLATVRTRLRRAIEQLREALDRSCGRGVWGAALLPLLPRRAPEGLAAAALGGVLVMSKLKIAVVIVATTTVVTWWSWPAEPTGLPPRGVATNNVAALASPTTDGQASDLEATVERELVIANETSAEPGFLVRGRVVSAETGAPIQGATVRLFGRFGAMAGHTKIDWARYAAERLGTVTHPFEATASPGPPTGTTHADGTFEIHPEMIRTGNWSNDYLISAPGHAILLGDCNDLRPAPPEVNLGDVALPRGTQIRGFVRDENGAPTAGAHLFVAHGYDRRSPYLDWSTLMPAGSSSATGAFTLPERLPPFWLRHLLLAVTDDRWGWVELDPVTDRESLEVEVFLQPCASLEVNVVDENDAPIAGAPVLAQPSFQPFTHREVGSNPRLHAFAVGPDEVIDRITAKTDEDGMARFDALPTSNLPADKERGTRFVIASEVEGRTIGRAQPCLHPGDNPTVTIRLVPIERLAVTGTVRDDDGAPVVGAELWCRNERAYSDEHGMFALDIPWPLEAFQVVASAAGFVSSEPTFEPPGDDPNLHVDIRLERAMTIHGRVLDDEGQPVAGLEVRASMARFTSAKQDVRTFLTRAVNTDRDGRFRVDDTTRGLWRVQPITGQTFTPCRDVSVTGGTDDLLITLHRRAPATCRVEVELVDHITGAPIDATRALLSSGEPVFFGAPIHAQRAERSAGRITVDAVAPGFWRLQIMFGDERQVWHEFKVAPGDSRYHTRIEVGEGGIVEGRVVLDDIPLELRPEKIPFTIWYAGGRFVTPPGASASIQRNGHDFRVEDLVMGQTLTFRVDLDDVCGAATCTVRTDGVTPVDLRLQRAGHVDLRVNAFPEGPARFSIRDLDGTWRVLDHFTGQEGRPLDRSFALPAGRHAWRFDLLPPRTPSDQPPPITREGEIEIRAGERSVIRL